MESKIILTLLLLTVAYSLAKKEYRPRSAAEVKLSGSQGVKGTIKLRQFRDGWTEIRGDVRGLTPGPHGMHIHTSSDLSNSCANVGGHFDPHGMPHGQHVGDLGNILADQDGRARFRILKKDIQLEGPNSVLGRALGIDDAEDHEDEEHHHHDHATVACGVIKLSKRMPREYSRQAEAKLTSGSQDVRGVVKFREFNDGWTEVRGKIQGLTPGKHGMHIHTSGDLSDSCANVGDHFDPYGEGHGVHVGDLGNIEADQNGEVTFRFLKRRVELEGPNSILGKALGVDDTEDLFGDEKHVTIACGVIRSMKKRHG